MVAMRNPCIWCCLVLLTLVVCDSCLHEERKHLMDICDAFLWPAGNPPDWSSRDCCRWERVTCSSITGRVTALDLDAAYPSWYGLLNCSMFLPFRELQNLSLGNAGIAGRMPGAGLSKMKLDILDLSWNGIFGNISRVHFIYSCLQYDKSSRIASKRKFFLWGAPIMYQKSNFSQST